MNEPANFPYFCRALGIASKEMPSSGSGIAQPDARRFLQYVCFLYDGFALDG